MIIRKKFKQKFIEYTITEDNKNFKNNFFYRYIVENIKMNSKKILLYIFINVILKFTPMKVIFIYQIQIIYLCNSFKINEQINITTFIVINYCYKSKIYRRKKYTIPFK